MNKTLVSLMIIGLMGLSSQAFALQAFKTCKIDASDKYNKVKKGCPKGKEGKPCKKDAHEAYKKESKACNEIKRTHTKKLTQCHMDLRSARMDEQNCQMLSRALLEKDQKDCFAAGVIHKDIPKRNACLKNVITKKPEYDKRQQACLAKATPKVKALSDKCTAITKE